VVGPDQLPTFSKSYVRVSERLVDNTLMDEGGGAGRPVSCFLVAGTPLHLLLGTPHILPREKGYFSHN
jgi:hypothetical protein